MSRVAASFVRAGGVVSCVVLPLVAACNSSTGTDDTARTATTIVVNDGVEGQVANVTAAVPTLPSVTVRDQLGQPLPGAIVLWSVRTGGGTVGFATTGTDSLGGTSTSWVLGRTAGTQVLAASIASGDSVRITATARALSPTQFELIDGDNQELSPGATSTPFQVRAQDQYLNAVPDHPVYWQTTAGTLTADTTRTNAAGVASVQLTVPAATSTVTVTARLANGATLSFQARVRP